MAIIFWSPKAINELGRICDYISENSEYYARRKACFNESSN
ncbi:MAG: hypothetical protein ACNYVW_05160 [Methanosarcinales archaeon]